MRIESIAARADLIETVARWQFDEWGYREPGDSLAARIADLSSQAAHPGRLPSTFVALDGDEPLGSASVMREDAAVFRASPRQRGLTPWLASVYVRPEARGRGVATALVRRVMAQVAALGVAWLYLFTEGARGLYEKIGWRVIGTDRYEGLEMTIMAIDLTPDATPAGEQ
ncbi:MAG: GNAT family N-acetyltransferase [Thermomicrobiales bacterium]